MKKTFYEKVGRRYVPVSEFDSDLSYALPKGNHLVMVYPGGRSRRYNIDPNYAAMIAAGRIAEDAICDVLHKASEAKPKRPPITDRQFKAWQEMKAAFGDEFFNLNYGSIRDYAEAGVDAMQAEAMKLMQHEAVRDAYEQFQSVCKLVKQTS
jgi:hypothetical protein